MELVGVLYFGRSRVKHSGSRLSQPATIGGRVYLKGHTGAQGQESTQALDSMVPTPWTEGDGVGRMAQQGRGEMGARRAACGRKCEGQADVRVNARREADRELRHESLQHG